MKQDRTSKMVFS